MKVDCPSCGKQLRIGGKAEESIAQLAPGKLLRVKCAQCSVPFGIDSEQQSVALGGDGVPLKPKNEPAKEAMSRQLTADGRKTNKSVTPPPPPDLSWLVDGIFDDHEVVEEVPLALVMIGNADDRLAVVNAIEGIGYKAEIAKSSEEAIEKMAFVNYSNVVLHSKFEGVGINGSNFHQHMARMDMSKRRYIFYTLIGPEFKTLYNLQALSFSANLVVNDKQIKDFNVILRKVIPEYELLFGPLMEELHIQRK